MPGKQRRLRRLFNRQSGKTLMVPIDHAVTMGPKIGLEHPKRLIDTLVQSGVDAIIGHKGILKLFHESLAFTPFVFHLSGATNLGSDPGYKALVGDVETAVAMGADAVSIHVTLGHPQEREMLSDLGRVSAQCDRFGMPLLVMAYFVRSAKNSGADSAPELHTVRVAQELGADMIKIAYPGDNDRLAEVVASSEVPVIVGGGARDAESTFMRNVGNMMATGIAGLAVGRHVFQARDIAAGFSELYAAVHNPNTVHRIKSGR
jgi:DhnA family fructose-bisphosphate aldolase class Ia